jgi:hypothetical protein
MIRFGAAFLVGSLVLLLINAVGLGPTYIPGFPHVADKALELLYAILRLGTPDVPLVSNRLLDLLYMLLPGLVGGCILKSKGALIGASIGLTGAIITLIDGYVFVGNLRQVGILETIIGEVLPQTIAGLAGVQLIQRRAPPNNSFKPNPLRGSA